MRKANIEKILERSPAERMNIICNYRACLAFGVELPITQEEYEILNSSFNTNYEIDIYNKKLDQESRIRHYIPSIHNTIYLFTTKIEEIKGYLKLCLEYKREEETINRILLNLEDDEFAKSTIIDMYKKRDFTWACTKIDNEGFIIIDTKSLIQQPSNDKLFSSKTSLEDKLNKLSDDIQLLISQIKSKIETVLLFLNKAHLKIPYYKKLVKTISENVENYTNKAFHSIFSPTNKIHTKQSDILNEHYIYDNFFKIYWFLPDFYKIEVNHKFIDDEYNIYFRNIE